ncbi:MAG: 30S ribosomal protein S27e [Candidatus Diapherotrites archaeon]|nr:30S ribosomal protein S27e [Candidatus Diapherotrites archaeon]
MSSKENATIDSKLVKQLGQKKSDFLKIKCNGCGGEQVTFSHPSKPVKCLVCDKVLAKTTGSKLELVQGQIVQLLK